MILLEDYPMKCFTHLLELPPTIKISPDNHKNKMSFGHKCGRPIQKGLFFAAEQKVKTQCKTTALSKDMLTQS